MQNIAARGDSIPVAGSASKRAFARHFAEMVVAMLLGMGILEGLAAIALASAGSSLSDQSGAVRVTLMGLSMTVPMVLWMRHRGHAVGRIVEMAASMLLPSGIAAVLAAAGVLSAGAALAVQHAVMVPAMLGVMLWRYAEYARLHAAPRGDLPCRAYRNEPATTRVPGT